MDLTCTERLWRVGMLIILVTLLQASTSHGWFISRRRRSPPPPPPPQPVKCVQSAWSPWSECSPFCDIVPTRSRSREVMENKKCVRKTTHQDCPSRGGCQQQCNSIEKKCACYASGYNLDNDGKTCIDKDECKSNGGRGPCSHSCRNTDGDYFCSCETGYRLDGRTKCELKDCGLPTFTSCPQERKKEGKKRNSREFSNNLALCENIKEVCGNGTKYNAQCSLSCPKNYKLALKLRPDQQWSDYNGAFDFHTPSNRIMCHVVHGTVTWHVQLAKYVCRRSNDPPLSIELSDSHIKESQPARTVVGQLTAFDAQSHQHIVYSTYSLDDGKPLFRCRDRFLESVVTLKWKPRGQNSYPVLIRAQDDGSPRMWLERVFNITVTNVEDAPRGIEISRNSVYENASRGTIVGELSAVDDDVGQGRSSQFIWTMLSNSENFEITGANVVVKKPLDYDFSKVHYIKVRCNDSVKFSETKLLIYVINSIDPPTLSLAGNKVLENSKVGTVIGQIEAQSESNSDITFTLSASNAHVQNKFALSPTPVCRHHENATKFNTTCYVNLTVSGDLDYEDKKEYIVQVFVRNKESNNFQKWNISIEDVNEKPDKMEFNGMTEIPESTKSGEDFCFIMVSDPDNRNTMNQLYACYVNQGGDGEYFQVNNLTNALQVKVNKILDYEIQQTYHVSLTCTDDGTPALSITQDLIINVTDTDEPIENITLSKNEIWENATVGTEIGVLSAYDPDVPPYNSMTFSIVHPDDGPFRLQGDNDQVLALDKPINFEEKSTLVITIRVNDTTGSYLQWPFRINVLDVNERPTDILLSTQSMKENLVEGSLISNITMVDEDENTMASCEILQDGDGRISVNETMLIAGARAANYETNSSMILGISLKCCDQFTLCVTKNFSIQIKDVNEPPTDITIINSLEVMENQKDLYIGNIIISDPDENQNHSCALSNQTEYLRIIKKADDQMLYLIKELNFEQESVKSFQINCTEVGTVSTYSLTQQFDLLVLDTNEAPTKGCSYPLYVSREQSPGTVLGNLNVTDPDNEISNSKDQDPCQHKQQLRYTIHSKNKDEPPPFRVADGYLVKTGEIQANKTYSLTISVEDDGVISGRSSRQTITTTFNCTVISTILVRPQITLSANQVDEYSKNGTKIGDLNTMTPTHLNNTYYGNKTYEYQLVKERCSSYPFVVVDNKLRLKFYETRGARQKNEDETPNYVIIQVKNNASGASNDVISARFMILIKNEKKLRSWICFSNKTILINKEPNMKLGPIRIYNATSNHTVSSECPQNDKDITHQGHYICNVKPSLNNSSTDFKKVNLTNKIYVDHEMFLRINTSLGDEDLNLDKLVLHVTCWDPTTPLHFARGDLTIFLKDCSRKTSTEDGVCVSCKHKPCKKDQVCIDLKPKGYECKPSKNTCEQRNNERDNSLCVKPQCKENSLCSKMMNSSSRCVDSAHQLFIGLPFLLRQNSYCKFEKCLEDILGNKGGSCLGDLAKERTDQHRQKRGTKNEFSAEILQLSSSSKKSLVFIAVWKLKNGERQLANKSLLTLLQNTDGVVYIKTKEDCARIFQEKEIKCPIHEDHMSSDIQSGNLLERPKIQAALGVGVAIVFIVIVIVIVYFWKKRRDKKRQMAKRPSICPVMGDFENLAFDGMEMSDAGVERKKRPQKKNKKKKAKPKHNFKNPVYEEPSQLETIRRNQDEKHYENIGELGEYMEPQATAEISNAKGEKSISNPYYATIDNILVERPKESSEQNLNSNSPSQQPCNATDQHDLSRTKVNNSKKNVMETNTAINKYPYYEELPPIQDRKHESKKYKGSKDNNEKQETTINTSPIYHVLESTPAADGQQDRNNSDENKEQSSPHYFVLEQNASTEKQYQSLHRELDSPPPEYESYKVPTTSGAKDNNQAAEAPRVYDEPFLEKPKPKVAPDS